MLMGVPWQFRVCDDGSPKRLQVQSFDILICQHIARDDVPQPSYALVSAMLRSLKADTAALFSISTTDDYIIPPFPPIHHDR